MEMPRTQLHCPDRLAALSVIAHIPTFFLPLISLGSIPFRHMHTLECGLDRLSGFFPTLVCPGLTGESTNSLTPWQNHLNAVRRDMALHFARLRARSCRSPYHNPHWVQKMAQISGHKTGKVQ